MPHRYDGVRYGVQAAGDRMTDLYGSSRAAGLGPEVKRRILMGTYALSSSCCDVYYRRAQQVRALVQRDMDAALAECDVLLSPVAPTVAYALGDTVDDPFAMYKGDLMTVNLNLAGLPAVSMPVGTAETADGTLPVGAQLIGRAFGENELLRVAHVLEQAIGFVPLQQRVLVNAA